MEAVFVDTPYSTDQSSPGEQGNFFIIYRVDVDDTYDVSHRAGLFLHAVFITMSGEGLISMRKNGDHPVFSLEPRSIFFLEQGTAYRYHTKKGGRWAVFQIFFTDPEILAALGLSANRPYRVPSVVALHQACESIITECINKNRGYQLEIDNLFRHLVITVAREALADLGTSDPAITAALHWMHGNYDKPLVIDSLLRLVRMNRRSFFKKFKMVTGTSPVVFFLNLKFEAACIMLVSTGKKINEIAALLGFYDEFYFSRMFKKRYGVSPTQFRDAKRDAILPR